MCADHFRFKWGENGFKKSVNTNQTHRENKSGTGFFLVRDVYVRKVSELYRRIQLLQAEM